MVKLVNWRHLNEYARIFGLSKMHGLWCEFVKQGTFSWKEIETGDLEGRRLIFHSWKSSSQIFGMDEFSALCASLEEHILSRRLDKLDEAVEQCRQCYHNSVQEIIPYFAKMDDKNDRTDN